MECSLGLARVGTPQPANMHISPNIEDPCGWLLRDCPSLFELRKQFFRETDLLFWKKLPVRLTVFVAAGNETYLGKQLKSIPQEFMVMSQHREPLVGLSGLNALPVSLLPFVS